MYFLREHLNSRHKKHNTNNSASKARSCKCSGKNLVYSIKKCSIFSLISSLYKYSCKTWIKNAHFNPFCQYMLLLTKIKQVFKLTKDKKEIGVTFLAVIPL